MIVMDASGLLLLSGNGEVIEPDDGILAIGSGGSFALAAGRALHRHAPQLSAKEIAHAALRQLLKYVCLRTIILLLKRLNRLERMFLYGITHTLSIDQLALA